MLTLKVEGTLRINDTTATVLHHICSYDLQKWFAEHCSHRFTEEQLRAALQDLRAQTSRIEDARETAIKAVNAKAKAQYESGQDSAS
jgi:hypothetical protein